MFSTMPADEDLQFHLDPSPKKQVKNEETTKKHQNLCIICQKKGNKQPHQCNRNWEKYPSYVCKAG